MEKRKIVINGSGSAGGGEYSGISIRGEGRVQNDTKADVVKVYGQGTFKMNLKSGFTRVMGQMDIEGELEADYLKVYGQATIWQNVMTKKAKIRGQVFARRNFTSEEIDNKGELDVSGNVTADRFVSTGVCRIQGLLTAEEVFIDLRYHSSSITEIGGGRVSVSRKSNIVGVKSKRAQLVVSEIEADDIYVEYTKATAVRGNNVKIGPGCEIGIVEYKDSVKIAPNTKVGEQLKR